MNDRFAVIDRLAIALLIFALAGCAQNAPRATATASPSATEAGPRFLIHCVTADGGDVGTFTRLEEAWASTNYMRIDHCEAQAGEPSNLELNAEETNVASIASADLPDEDPVDLFLRTLAACVRLPSQSDDGIASQPSSLLEAVLTLCPEAPQAGLIEAELESRG